MSLSHCSSHPVIQGLDGLCRCVFSTLDPCHWTLFDLSLDLEKLVSPPMSLLTLPPQVMFWPD